MKRCIWSALAALVIPFVLSGCAALDLKRPVPDASLSSIKNVGVLSMLGQQFNGVLIGTTVFNNAQFKAEVPGWEVDAFATRTTLALLANNGKFKAVPVDRGTLSAEQLRADKGERLWAEARKQGIDTLVILYPGVSDNYRFFTPGVGLMERKFLNLGSSCVYAAYTVTVYDVATRESLGWEWGGPSPCEWEKEGLGFKPQLSDYSADEQGQMRRKLETRIKESLVYALGKLKLRDGSL